jgi:hypothetical protein
MNEVKEAIKRHNRFCNCTPQWRQGEFGQELVCQKEGTLLWWPVVKSSLSDSESLALFCVLPMRYDSDGDSVNLMLLRLGYTEINSENFQEAYNAIVRQFEHELWQDNVGKQLLGRLLDSDL